MASHRISIRKGFTLLEVLIILGLIAVVGALGLIISLDDYRAFHMHNERDMVVAVLQKARSQAINNMCFGSGCTDGKSHGVYFDHAGHYVIFQGASYGARDTAIDESIDAKDDAALITGSSEIVFAPLTGNVATTLTVTVTDVSGRISVITVEPEGRIWWTN